MWAICALVLPEPASGGGDELFADGFEEDNRPQKMRIELWWDTPLDPDPNDTGPGTGADLDLLLRHPDASDWFDATQVCYWLNPSPDWGVPADNSDDPSLELDDADGWGPEIINFEGLETGAVYRLGAAYFDDHGFGASIPSLKLFWKDELVVELTGGLMAGTDYFWESVNVERVGSELDITIINTVTATPP